MSETVNAVIGRRSLLQLLAAPKLTVAFFLMAAGSSYWVSQGAVPTLVITPPLALLVINLLAALIVHKRFRADLPLLVFHLALVTLVILFIIARLTYLEGRAAITRGATFNGQLITAEKGLWHPDHYQQLRFTNSSFIDDFPTNGDQYLTYNTIDWIDNNTSRQLIIGDDIPLVLSGYRFYATNRGFTPKLMWQTTSGSLHAAEIQLGDVQFDGWHEGRNWTPNTGPKLWLSIDHQVTKPDKGSIRIDLGVEDISPELIVRVNDQRYRLQQGQSLQLDEGTLTYRGLNVWLGYQVVYDPTTPWLIATALIGIISMIAFYLKRIFRPYPKESIK